MFQLDTSLIKNISARCQATTECLSERSEPMPTKDMDIDKLRKDAAEMIDAAVVQGR